MASKLFFKALYIIIVATLVCGFVYMESQQSLRQSANDPQIQIAEDLAKRIESEPQANFGDVKINIATSLATFVVIYDSTGKPLSGNGFLNGQLPTLPTGVLDASKQTGQNRVTWQPENGVRVALVVNPIHGGSLGYVAVGRNLRETEKRASQSLQLTIVMWLILNAVGFVGLFIFFTKETPA